MPGKPVSKSRNEGLVNLIKSGEKGKSLAKKFGYDPDRMVANKGGRAALKDGGGCMQIKGFGKARKPKKKKYA